MFEENRNILVFDIETIPDVEGLRRLYALDAGLSDAEVVNTMMQQRLEKSGRDFFPHHLQRVLTIACILRWTKKNGEPGLHLACLGSEKSLQDPLEKELLQQFFQLIDDRLPELVSWNGGGFDLPVLHYRSLRHQVVAPSYWHMGEANPSATRSDFKWNNYINRYHLRHLDLMDVLSLYQPRAYAGLDELAKLCGFPGKMGMDGNQVWPAYQAGRIADIRRYCEMDVVNTYLLYCRFQLMRGYFSATVYDEEIAYLRCYLEQKGQDWQEYLALL